MLCSPDSSDISLFFCIRREPGANQPQDAPLIPFNRDDHNNSPSNRSDGNQAVLVEAVFKVVDFENPIIAQFK
jgi:hypothetical protein